MPRTAEHSSLGVRQIARHLQDPHLIRVCRDAGDDDVACGQVDHEEDAVCDQAPPTPDIDRKEVAGRDRFPVRLQKHRPRNTSTAGRCGLY